MPNPSSAAGRPRITKAGSADSGAVYEYRGAVIYSNEKGTIFSFKLDGFPHGHQGYWGGLGHMDVVVDLVNAWLDTGRLPPPYVQKG